MGGALGGHSSGVGPMGGTLSGCGCEKRKGTVDDDGLKYPMWVLPMEAFLLMQGGPPLSHQELRDQGLLREQQAGDFIIFLSHQWLSKPHPDPEGKQIEVFCNAIQGIIEGRVPVQTSILDELVGGKIGSLSWEIRAKLRNCVIWYDYWSVPQIGARNADHAAVSQDMLKAVESIPVYVSMCHIFVAVVPPLTHQDTGATCDLFAWRDRGWCRVEAACQALRPQAASIPAFHVTSEASVEYFSAADWLQYPPGSGTFTCPEDKKDMVGPVMRRALEIKKRSCLRRNDMDTYRALTALTEYLMEGLEERRAETSTASAFLAQYRFGSIAEAPAAGLGMSPLFCAALAQDAVMIKEIISQMADPNESFKGGNFPGIRLAEDYPPIFCASSFGSSRLGSAVRALVECRADVDHKFGIFLNTPLLGQSFFGNFDGMRALMDARADTMALSSSGFGVMEHFCLVPANSLLPHLRLETLRSLLDAKANPNAVAPRGNSALGPLAMHPDCSGAMELMIERKADVNLTGPMEMTPARVQRLEKAREARQIERASDWGFIVTEMCEAPALVIACEKSPAIVKVLLAARADVNKRNRSGISPVDMARMDYRVEPPVPRDTSKAPTAEILALLESYGAKPEATPSPNQHDSKVRGRASRK